MVKQKIESTRYVVKGDLVIHPPPPTKIQTNLEKFNEGFSQYSETIKHVKEIVDSVVVINKELGKETHDVSAEFQGGMRAFYTNLRRLAPSKISKWADEQVRDLNQEEKDMNSKTIINYQDTEEEKKAKAIKENMARVDQVITGDSAARQEDDYRAQLQKIDTIEEIKKRLQQEIEQRRELVNTNKLDEASLKSLESNLAALRDRENEIKQAQQEKHQAEAEAQKERQKEQDDFKHGILMQQVGEEAIKKTKQELASVTDPAALDDRRAEVMERLNTLHEEQKLTEEERIRIQAELNALAEREVQIKDEAAKAEEKRKADAEKEREQHKQKVDKLAGALRGKLTESKPAEKAQGERALAAGTGGEKKRFTVPPQGPQAWNGMQNFGKIGYDMPETRGFGFGANFGGRKTQQLPKLDGAAGIDLLGANQELLATMLDAKVARGTLDQAQADAIKQMAKSQAEQADEQNRIADTLKEVQQLIGAVGSDRRRRAQGR